MRNQKGFTLIEMLIVLTIISTLLILLIPNLADKNQTINTKGCDALAKMAEGQLLAYEIDTGTKATDISTLVEENYLETQTCANGSQQAVLSEDGVEIVPIEVSANNTEPLENPVDSNA